MTLRTYRPIGAGRTRRTFYGHARLAYRDAVFWLTRALVLVGAGLLVCFGCWRFVR